MQGTNGTVRPVETFNSGRMRAADEARCASHANSWTTGHTRSRRAETGWTWSVQTQVLHRSSL